ncbi:MAG: putative selenate ABC transporter substrate-binding protein [Rhodomicrobium sp.]
MFRFVQRLVLGCLFSAAMLSFSFAQNATFSFTLIPDQDDAALVKRFGKLVPYLEKKLGVRVAYVPVSSYEAAVKAFSNGKVQLGWFGAYSGAKARHAVPGSKVIAQGKIDQNFKTYFIAHVSSGIEPSKSFPRSIQGKSFVFGSRISTSGRLIPEYWIRRQFKVPPKDVFRSVSFSGDHSSTLDLVQAGAAQVGAMDYTVFEAAQREGKVDPAKVRVIWETPPFPDLSFVIRGDADRMFGQGFTSKVQQALVGLDDRELLQAFGRPKFIPASNEQYEFIEELAAIVESEEQEATALDRGVLAVQTATPR